MQMYKTLSYKGFKEKKSQLKVNQERKSIGNTFNKRSVESDLAVESPEKKLKNVPVKPLNFKSI
jgi:hypothetical protein